MQGGLTYSSQVFKIGEPIIFLVSYLLKARGQYRRILSITVIIHLKHFQGSAV